MGEEEIRGLMDCLALRIQALLRELDAPMPFAAPEVLANLAHDLAGGAGALGFMHLSSIAARLQATIPTNPADAERIAADLRREAEAVQARLQQSRELFASAAI